MQKAMAACLAAAFGCHPEEMAITRNSSESLQIAQNGIDLEPGDEVVTTEQDYGRMLTTWDQRARRSKITIKKINFPVRGMSRHKPLTKARTGGGHGRLYRHPPARHF